MKSVAILVAVAALASASPNPAGIPGNVNIDCAKPNANFCVSSNTILRCDASSLGKPVNCDNGMTCSQSGQMAGDAKCVGGGAPSSVTGVMSIPEGTSVGTATATESVTGTMSIPEGTNVGTATQTSVTGFVTIPEGTTSLGTAVQPTASQSSDDCPAPTNGANTTTGGHGGASSTAASSSAVPTAAAVVNNHMAGGALAAAVFAAAMML